MIGRACRHERDVQQASASGRWTTELRRHASECAPCREIAVVTLALSSDAPMPPRRLSPSILWAKAQHARRRRADTAAGRIIIGGQIVSAVIGVAVLAYFGSRAETWAGFATSLNVTAGGVPMAGLVAVAGLVTVVSLATFGWLTRQNQGH